MPTQQQLPSMQTILKSRYCATIPTNFDAARIEPEAFDTGSIGSLPTLAEAV